MTALFGDLRRDADGKNGPSHLFDTSTTQRRSVSPLDLLPGTKQDPVVTRGYFAFPPPCPDQSNSSVTPAMDGHDFRQAQQHPDRLGSENTEKPVDATEDEVQRRANERRRRLEKEQEMALLGEFEWVRSGGVLRDSNGRRDKVRKVRYPTLLLTTDCNPNQRCVRRVSDKRYVYRREKSPYLKDGKHTNESGVPYSRQTIQSHSKIYLGRF